MDLILEQNEFRKPLENVPMAYLQLDTGVDPISRTIYWDNDVTDMLPFYIKQRINLIAQHTGDSTTPINLYLNTPGGDGDASFGVLDVMRTAEMPINVIATGITMSAGVIIMLGATGKRISYKNTRFMFHQLWGSNSGKLSDIENTTAEYKSLQEKVFKLFVEKTAKKDIKYWKRFGMKADKYFSADEALELGIIDEIW